MSEKQRGKRHKEENKMELLSHCVIPGRSSCGQYEDEMSKRFLRGKACERNSKVGGRTKLKNPTDYNARLMWSEGEREGRKGWWVAASS